MATQEHVTAQEGGAREKRAEGGAKASHEEGVAELRKMLSALEGEIEAAKKQLEILQAEDDDESEIDPEDLKALDEAIDDLQAKEIRMQELVAEIGRLETVLGEDTATKLAEAVPAHDPESQARIDENRNDQAKNQAKRDEEYEHRRSIEAERRRRLGPEKAEEYTLIEDSIDKARPQLEKLREEVADLNEEIQWCNKQLYQSENGVKFLNQSYALELIEGVRAAKNRGDSSLLPEQVRSLERLAKVYREYNPGAKKMNLEEDTERYMQRDEASLADQAGALEGSIDLVSGQRSNLFTQQRVAEKTLFTKKSELRTMADEYNVLIDRSNELREQSGVTGITPAELRKFKVD